MIWENSIEICILSHMKQIVSPGLMHETGRSGLVHWDDPPFHLPPHTLPLGRPSALSPSIQYRASNLDWQLVSYMIFYMLQCHSPKSSHPLPLPQSPKACSIHQCLFCGLIHRVIVTIFLNSIYMHQYTVLVFFFLAYFTLYNRFQFHPSHQN